MSNSLKVAVIGGGVAGIVSAYLLSKKHSVTLFEKEPRLGGHTNTFVVPSGPDEGTGIDTGFIVLNDKNYPNFHKFLKALDVPVRYSDMSFSYYSELSGLQYAGTSINGLFADRKNFLRVGYYSFLLELARFCRQSQTWLRQDSLGDESLGEYLTRGRFSDAVIQDYIAPMGAAIWSASQADILEFPARSFLSFFENHGLLGFKDRPRWQTVVGGSHSYVKKFQQIFSGEVEIASPVQTVKRSDNKVQVVSGTAEAKEFDKVVFATHADITLKLIDEPTVDEQSLLGAWRYQKNRTVLHRDASFLPPNKRAWASWNYVREKGSSSSHPASVTYHMNRLQGIASQTQYCVTLNSQRRISEASTLYDVEYTHPTYSAEAVKSQVRLSELNGQRNSYFAGSYFGHGFHEDAVRSAVQVAAAFGLEL